MRCYNESHRIHLLIFLKKYGDAAMKKEVKAITVRLDMETFNALQLLAQQRGEHVAVITRRVIEDYLASKSAVDGVDVISVALRKVIRAELKPTEERLAKINAKTAIGALTSMYLNYFVIKEGKFNMGLSPKELYEEARVKAVADLRQRDQDNEGGK